MSWHARISVKRLVIAAASARPFVRAAAAAGYEVIAADVFSDEDTRRDALRAITLRYMQGGFDAGDVRTKLIPLLQASDTAFVFGSGFESQPVLLDEIARICPMFGNSAATVAAVKDPDRFFSTLLTHGIPHPDTILIPPASVQGWLGKRIGGSGGTHITISTPTDGRHYYQRQLPGKPFALLFLADGRQAVEVGYHEQWLAPVTDMPYRYGGAVSQTELPASVREGMRSASQLLTIEFGLRGLNSLDCMVAGESWWVLELNPRLSSSFSLYDIRTSGARLFAAHLAGCQGRLELPLEPESAQAHLIYYAKEEITIPPDMSWPAWVADVPASGTHVRREEPLCSIFATAERAEVAKMLALQRADVLTQQLSKILPERFL